MVVIVIVSVLVYSSHSNGNAITVGGLFNLTGYAGFAGEDSRNGFLMAIEDAHLSSSSVDTVIEDAGSDLKQTVSGAKKLVDIDHAIAVIGPEWTEFGEVVWPIAVQDKVPFLSPWVVAEALYVKPPYYWSATPSDRSEHAALADYLARHDMGRIALVYSNNFWSNLNIQMFKEEAVKRGSLTMISEDMLDQSVKDFRTAIIKIKAENPDAIYLAMGDDDSHGAFVTQARQLGLAMPIAANSSRADSPTMRDRYASVLHDQIFARQLPSVRDQEFEAKYQARFSIKPEAPSAAAAYDMTSIVLRAVKSGAKTSADIIEYMEHMTVYEGYSGTISFDSRGHVPLRPVIMERYNAQGVIEQIN